MSIIKNQKSIGIGSVCIVTYISSYYLRNLLGVLTPAMLKTELYNKEHIGLLSSAYMIVYALGQIVNGVLGDRFSSKKMVVMGLFLSGTASLLFPFCSSSAVEILLFGLLGYGLSMLRGPLMKIISENTSPKQARIICTFFYSASFIGSFIAGLFAAIFKWHKAFIVAGISLYVLAIAIYVIFTVFERKNIIQNSYKRNEKLIKIFSVFTSENFIYFLIMSMLNETMATSINFWIPTYLTEHLGFSSNTSNVIFVIKSIIRSFSPFIALFIYKYVNDGIKIMKYSFLFSAIPFFGMLFIRTAWLNVLLFIFSILIEGFAGTVIWSIYIPSLKSTGKVSSGNGIIDFSGYAFAALANIVFAQVASNIGWSGVIIVWTVIMLFGFFISVTKQIQSGRKTLRK